MRSGAGGLPAIRVDRSGKRAYIAEVAGFKGPGRLLLGPAHRDDDVQNTTAPKAKPEHQEKGHCMHALSPVGAASRGFRLAARILAASCYQF